MGIVGGGDVAIDAARTALRLGAGEVHVMYRRSGDDMPATHLPEEIEAALHEGIRFHTLVNPIEVLGDDHGHGRDACSGSGWPILTIRPGASRAAGRSLHAAIWMC